MIELIVNLITNKKLTFSGCLIQISTYVNTVIKGTIGSLFDTSNSEVNSDVGSHFDYASEKLVMFQSVTTQRHMTI